MNNDLKLNFGTDNLNDGWRVVNDGVMGGLSRGRMSYDETSVKFSGELSLENNGGFSWAQYAIRSGINGQDNHIKLRIKTDHHQYSITAKVLGEGSYHYESSTICTYGNWEEIKIPTASMIKTWRGRTFDEFLDGAAELSELGVILKDKKEGEFVVELDWVEIR